MQLSIEEEVRNRLRDAEYDLKVQISKIIKNKQLKIIFFKENIQAEFDDLKRQNTNLKLQNENFKNNQKIQDELIKSLESELKSLKEKMEEILREERKRELEY